MQRTTGFTFPQLLISLAVAGVLAGTALPAYTQAIARTRVTDAMAALSSSLLRASSEALMSSSHVTLCPSQEGATCTRSRDWQPGWIIFVDSNGSRSREPGESLIGSQQPLATSVRVRSSAGRDHVTYQPRGDASGTNGTFVICAEGHPDSARLLVLANSGRWRPAKASPAQAAQCR